MFLRPGTRSFLSPGFKAFSVEVELDPDGVVSYWKKDKEERARAWRGLGEGHCVTRYTYGILWHPMALISDSAGSRSWPKPQDTERHCMGG